MKIEARNQHVQYIVNARIEHVKTLNESDFLRIENKSEIQKILKDLIEINVNGFRGVVLTALVGMKLDDQYNPLTDFYGCNPRAIFEHGIWYTLTQHNIPCGKSDPLNVAKNIQELNESWATGRRPQSAALAAVNFLRKVVNSKSKEDRALLEDYFFFKLINYAKKISSIRVNEAIIDVISKQDIAKKLSKFALGNPESGATPQLLIGKIIKGLFSSSSFIVLGDDESVFGTNTTSKKPADIWIEKNNLAIFLFEVTLKKIDLKRLDDCIETLYTQGVSGLAVTFICRLPEDISSIQKIGLSGNSLVYKNKRFEFVDFSSFITSCCALLTDEQITQLTSDIRDFVMEVTTSIQTKDSWNEIFSS
jgi:hypothetical protein